MWWWILVWVLLLLGALVVIALLGWHLVRRGISLGRELGHSAEQVSDALAPVLDHYEPAHSVLSDPTRGARGCAASLRAGRDPSAVSTRRLTTSRLPEGTP